MRRMVKTETTSSSAVERFCGAIMANEIKVGEKNRKSDFSGASIGLLGVGHEGRGIKNDAEFVEFGGLNAQTENRNPARTVVDVLSDEVGGKKQNKRSESTEQSQMIDVAKMNELHHKSSECSQR